MEKCLLRSFTFTSVCQILIECNYKTVATFNWPVNINSEQMLLGEGADFDAGRNSIGLTDLQSFHILDMYGLRGEKYSDMT